MKIYKILFSLLFVALLTIVTAHSGFGATQSWTLDKAHSNIYFGVEHIFSEIRGHFNEFSVAVNFDSDDLANSSFMFEIRVDSIDTNISKRDKHLQSADFFDAGKYPTISFTSKTISDKGDGLFEISGTLTIKDQEYPLLIPLQLAGIKDHPTAKGQLVAGFNGSVTIDRLAYGVGNGKFYDLGIIGKEVDVLVSLELLSPK